MFRPCLSFLVLFALPLAAQQYEFTNDAIGDNSWTNPDNWKLPGQDPATDFPDNGAEALVEVGAVQLGKDILLTALEANLGGGNSIDLNGNTLQVTGIFTSSGADITNGSFISTALQLNSGIRLFNTTALAGNITASSGAVTLADGSTLTFDGTATLLGNGGFGALGTGPNTLTNQAGTLVKAGGVGFSDVAADYVQNGVASTEVQTGSLRFTGSAEINGGVLASTSRMIFDGPTLFDGPRVELTGNGRVECFDPVTLTGTLTSTHAGAGTTPGIDVRGGFAGGTLDCEVGAPFVMTGGTSSPLAPTTNLGAFFWDVGTLFDFTNNATARGEFVINNYYAVPGSTMLAGRFINSGHVLQESPSMLTLDTDGIFENQAGATYENTGGNIGAAGGASGHLFLNAGTFLRPVQDAAGSVTISAPFTSTGEVRVLDNGLRIQGPASISGTLLCDRSSRPDALLELGGAGQVIEIGDTTFDCLGDGLIEFEGGEFRLGGLLESRESDGLVHVRSGSVDLVVQAGTPAALDFSDFVPLRLGSDNNTPDILLADVLTNTGRIDIFRAVLGGAAPLKNTGTLFLDSVLDIGASPEGGQLVNNGLIDFPTLNGLRIRMNPGGLLLNNEPGGIDANPTGGTILLGIGDEIVSTSAATEVQVVNKGDILISENGGATIAAVFEQDGSNTPTVETQRGVLSFTRPARFLAGEIRSTYLDFGTDSNPSDVRFSEDTTFGAVTMVLENSGEVSLDGSSFDNDIFTLEATLTAQGDGVVEMTGGTLVPEAGNGGTGFNCPGDTRFQFTTGIIGALGESLANVGNFDQTGGTIVGDFTNGGIQSLDNGSTFAPSIDGNFLNTDTFTWSQGKIAGNFSNGSAATPDAGVMHVEIGLSSRELDAATTLSNWNLLEQEARIRCGSDVIVRQNSGVLTLRGSAAFDAATSSSGHRFEMNGGTLLIDDVVENTHAVQLDAFEMNGGTLHALTGNLAVNSPSLTVNGGTLRVPAGRQISFQASAAGPGFEAIEVDGVVDFNNPGASAALQAGGLLSGTGTVEVDLTQNGEVAPGNSAGALTLDGDLTQSATAETTIEISPTAHDLLAVTGSAALGGTLRVLLIDGAAPAPGETFTILTAASVSGSFDTINVSGFDVGYEAGSVVLTATGGELDYDTWAEGEFTPTQLADPLVSGPEADADSDGVANLFEFIFGSSPNAPGDSFPIRFTTTPDPADSSRRIPVFEVTTAPDRGGYLLEILGLGDLATPADDVVLPSTTAAAPDDVLILQAVDSLPGEAAFFALRATLQP